MKYSGFLLLVIVFLLAACQQTEPPVASNTEPSPVAESKVASVQPAQTVVVEIYPQQPKRNECLEVTTTAYGDLSYAWMRNGELLVREEMSRLCDPQAKKGDIYQAIVRNAQGNYSAEVPIVNSPPRIKSLHTEPDRVVRGMPLKVVVTAEDPDGDQVGFRYQWFINGQKVAGETRDTLPGEAYEKGDLLSIEVVPFDDEEDGTVFVSDGMEIPNAPPRFLSTPPQKLSGTNYRYAAQVTDVDDDPVTFDLAVGPKGMVVDPDTGLVSWAIPDTAFSGQSYRVVLRATDIAGASTDQEFFLNLPAR